MEIFPNGTILEIPQGCFPLSTDSMVLAWFASLPPGARVLDLGSGCGTLGLLLCDRWPACRVTGIEAEAAAHAGALRNIARNGLADRMESICADFSDLSEIVSPGSFSVCISNPPYFSAGARSRSFPAARQEGTGTLDALLRSAAWALKFGGDLFLVHKPDRLAQVLVLGARYQLECKKLCLVRHHPGAEVSLVLFSLRKGGKPGLQLRELTLFDQAGQPTREYREIYHLQEVM